MPDSKPRGSEFRNAEPRDAEFRDSESRNAEFRNVKTRNSKTVKVLILDKEYRVNCSKDEVPALQKSASYLDEKMRAMKESSNALRPDNLAVMTALNITNDLLMESGKATQLATQGDAIAALTDKLDTALSRLKA